MQDAYLLLPVELFCYQPVVSSWCPVRAWKNVGTMTRQLDLSSQAAWLVDTKTTLITIKTAQPKQITIPAVAGLNVVL